MSSTELEEHKKLWKSLRELEEKFNSQANQRERTDRFDYSSLQALKVNVSSMDLDNPDRKPKFFTACPSDRLLNPDVEYERDRITYAEFESTDPIYRRPIDCARHMIAYFSSYIAANDIVRETQISVTSWSSIRLGERAFKDLDEYDTPEFGVDTAIRVQDFSYPHEKAIIYNNLEGEDGQLLRGEIILASRLIRAQSRWLALAEHMTVPALLFSFMGPKHARIIEAYFDGERLIMRPTPLFDLRIKDEALIKRFGQWYFGEPTGDTRELVRS